eukprot:2429462-Rhodomonas_salina.1
MATQQSRYLHVSLKTCCEPYCFQMYNTPRLHATCRIWKVRSGRSHHHLKFPRTPPSAAPPPQTTPKRAALDTLS